MKKIVLAVLITALILGSSALSYGAGYTDIKSTNWAYEAVNTMSEKAIIKGYPDGSLKPNNTITYGEFIKMALIADTGEDIGNSSTGHWALNYYNKALELGYFTKYDIYTGHLGVQITRDDMALIISSILGDVKIEDNDEIQMGIKDITPETKHDKDIIKSYESGILTGYPDKTFKPNKTLSRAEAAVVIYRLIDPSKRVLPGSDKTATIGYSNWDRTFETTIKTAQLGDSYGIVKFEIVQYGYVKIYSTVKYDDVSLVIDNKLVTGFGNPKGTNYWEEDGYYIYYSEPKKDGIDIKGKKLAVLATTDARFGADTGVLEFPGVTL